MLYGKFQQYMALESGFVKATSSNLPKVDSAMVFEFYRDNPDFFSAEMRNVKASRCGRVSSK